jgi:hypothetical protein
MFDGPTAANDSKWWLDNVMKFYVTTGPIFIVGTKSDKAKPKYFSVAKQKKQVEDWNKEDDCQYNFCTMSLKPNYYPGPGQILFELAKALIGNDLVGIF